MLWLLESSVRQAIENAEAVNAVPTMDQQAQFHAAHISGLSDGSSRIMRTAGNTAVIDIEGVLTKTPSFLAMIFGGGNTTYAEINKATAEAEADNTVENIEYYIDSPGGAVDGLLESIEVVKNATKPTKAIIRNLGASAAYSLASAADKIEAYNRAARVGSVGVIVRYFVSSSEVAITSTKAPKKNPDVTTDEGKAIVREELDGIHDLIVDEIANGRNTSAENINATYGEGVVYLADEALKRGMIDSIAQTNLRAVKIADSQAAADGGDNIKGENTMDLNKLRAEHPDLYNQVVQIGIDSERDRCTAHLTMGRDCNAMDVAIEAIEQGTGMTATLTAKYVSSATKKAEISNREGDEVEAADALSGANTGGEGSGEGADESEQVAALVEKSFGFSAKA